MSTITELFASIWRNYVTDGVPESGVYDAPKSTIRDLGAAIDVQKAEAVADLAAVKALTSRPLLVFAKALEQFYVWNAGSTATPDDTTVIECTAGDAGRYLLWVATNPSPTPLLTGHIAGLTYAKNGSNTIDIAAGVATANDGETVMSYAGDTALDLAALFDDDGLLDTGTVANTNYELYLVRNPGTEDVRPLAVVEGDAPTLPSGYTQYRKFGWLKREAGSIVAFNTYELSGGGIEFKWANPREDIRLSATLTSTRRLDALSVPLNFSVLALITPSYYDTVGITQARICSPDEADAAVYTPNGAYTTGVRNGNMYSLNTELTSFGDLRIRTNASGQIAARTSAGATADLYVVQTNGFEWSRR